ncbi:hypothetical protein K2173_020335 [Erythroxylum novogranatense]|uniref:GDSL esterase/lipase 7 n=1 Tax=Erythroxylum novogranatense TaxID=1862640 RepID=A0AAV8U7N2_9ROSI|nr:hypothetical protein K2173_020335 [Erythroxylum novogranatense]
MPFCCLLANLINFFLIPFRNSSMELIVLLLLFLHLYSAVTIVLSSSPCAPALYVFGDSMFDNGNNNFLPTLAKVNFLPYGVNFAEGPTGRFSNGRIIPDYIAEYTGLPYPPPYLSIKESTPVTGLNYASGSCGILPKAEIEWGKCLTLDDQIELFQRTVESELPKSFENTNQLMDYLSNSVFVFSIGSNDYLNIYLEPNLFHEYKIYTPQEFADLLLSRLSQRFERLYNLGVGKLVMLEIGPVGCIPSITRNRANQNGKCDEESNQIVSYFNRKLPQMLRNLTSTLQASTLVQGRFGWLAYDAIMKPSNYGLEDTSNPCCITLFNGICIPWLKACINPDDHLFFDGYHITEALVSVIAAHCIADTSVCNPTIIQLIEM